jgi:hypothetical protein
MSNGIVEVVSVWVCFKKSVTLTKGVKEQVSIAYNQQL